MEVQLFCCDLSERRNERDDLSAHRLHHTVLVATPDVHIFRKIPIILTNQVGKRVRWNPRADEKCVHSHR